MSNEITPIEKKRAALLKMMEPPTREAAREFETLACKGSKGQIMIRYAMGERLKSIMDDTATYGAKAVEQLAAYLTEAGFSGGETMLYSLRNWTDAFTKQYVEEQQSIPMKSGGFLSLGHWMELTRTDEADRVRLLARIHKESLSTEDLKQEIRSGGAKAKNARSGGRKPSSPSSFFSGLGTTYSLGNKFNNWADLLDESVFAPIEKLDSEKVNDKLLEQLQKTREAIAKTGEVAKTVADSLGESIERVERVLAKKTAAAKNVEEDDEAAPAPAKAKVSEKPKVKGKLKADKKKSKRPAMAR